MGKSLRGSRPEHRKGRPARAGLLPMTTGEEEILRVAPHRAKAFEPRSERQAIYASTISACDLTFGLGPAGTGKTWVAGALAAKALQAREVDRIIITRPAVEAGESLGFLPGTLEEKFDPYFRPFRHVLETYLGRSHVEALVKTGKIEALPLALMRGHTFEGFVVLDEAQNTTPVQMKLFLTRLGEGSTCVISGDLRQKDIPGPSGLWDAINRLHRLPGVGVVEFTRADIVRSGLVQRIVEAYEGEGDEDDFDPRQGLEAALR